MACHQLHYLVIVDKNAISRTICMTNQEIFQRQRTKSRTLKDIHEAKLRNADKSIKREKKSMKLDPVIIYDVHCLFNINRHLGEHYM